MYFKSQPFTNCSYLQGEYAGEKLLMVSKPVFTF